MARKNGSKCIICELRPPVSNGWCAHCQQQIEAAKRQHEPEPPFRYVTYKGCVVGMFRKDGGYVPRLLQRDPGKLPKSRTINLDEFCEGFTRDQIHKLKRGVLRTAGA